MDPWPSHIRIFRGRGWRSCGNGLSFDLMGTRISNLIGPHHVLALKPGLSKLEAIQAMASTLSQADGLDNLDEIIRRVVRREDQVSTGIGAGVAIPHCTISGIDRPHVLFATCPEGIDFDSVDGAPVQIFFLVLAPEGRPSVYLKLLARISRLVNSPDFRMQLISTQDPNRLAEILSKEDQRHP